MVNSMVSTGCARRVGLGVGSWAPLEGAGGHGRSVSDAQLGRLLIFLFEIFLGEHSELLTVFLLDGGALAVELLDILEPGNAVAYPGVGGFKAILERRRVSRRDRMGSFARDAAELAGKQRRDERLGEEATNLELCAKGGHGVGLSHGEGGGRRLLGSERERQAAEAETCTETREAGCDSQDRGQRSGTGARNREAGEAQVAMFWKMEMRVVARAAAGRRGAVGRTVRMG